jgi:hypothetical protein
MSVLLLQMRLVQLVLMLWMVSHTVLTLTHVRSRH